ncbi:MAG: flagellar basal body-associated FliL family protein [Cellvibrio sp.]|uniref:flagellar basal body-associated FliL family protein n=1 Tax=Cellvibrio sp. TaxID=1965322 RepID=UPI0031B3B90A
MSMTRVVLIMLVLNTVIALGSVYINYNMFTSIRAQAQAPATAINPDDPNAPIDRNIAKGDAKEFVFHTVEKIIVSLQEDGREHYFVFDVVLQAEEKTDPKKLESLDPMVRSSVVAKLSQMTFSQLRAMPINELQTHLENTLLDDFASKKIVAPFAHVLVSKLIVQ